MTSSTARRSYQDLIVWQRAIDLVAEIYQLSRRLPAAERFGVASQMQRAAVSIPANIAEGAGRASRRELLYHLSVARGSRKELETLLIVVERIGCLSQPDLARARDLCEHISRMLYGLRRKLLT